MTTYSDKLKSPKWQKKRLEILQLHNFKCDVCNNDNLELHVHHIKYILNNEIWDYPNDNFKVLCIKCHKIEHDKLSLEFKIGRKQIPKNNNISIRFALTGKL